MKTKHFLDAADVKAIAAALKAAFELCDIPEEGPHNKQEQSDG